MKAFLILASAGLVLAAPPSFAADLQAGAQLAARCVACHGQHGMSTSPNYPNLAGQKPVYLKKQLADFAAGKRIDPLMSAMVKGLSEQDMDNLADFFSRQKP